MTEYEPHVCDKCGNDTFKLATYGTFSPVALRTVCTKCEQETTWSLETL